MLSSAMAISVVSPAFAALNRYNIRDDVTGEIIAVASLECGIGFFRRRYGRLRVNTASGGALVGQNLLRGEAQFGVATNDNVRVVTEPFTQDSPVALSAIASIDTSATQVFGRGTFVTEGTVVRGGRLVIEERDYTIGDGTSYLQPPVQCPPT